MRAENIAGFELLTAFRYFAAVTLAVGSSGVGRWGLSLLVLYNIIYVLPLVAIVIVRAVTAHVGVQGMSDV